MEDSAQGDEGADSVNQNAAESSIDQNTEIKSDQNEDIVEDDTNVPDKDIEGEDEEIRAEPGSEADTQEGLKEASTSDATREVTPDVVKTSATGDKDAVSPDHHDDLTNTDRYNIHHEDLTDSFHKNATKTTNQTKKRTGRWDLTGLQTEIIMVEGHKVILHHGSNFYILDKDPVTDDPMSYILDKKTNMTLCSMKERADHLHKKCQENGWKRWDEMPEDEFRTEDVPNLLVDDKHKLMFCQSLKKSSTNKWIKFIGIATGEVKEFKNVPIHHMEVIGMKGLKEYSPEEIRERLRNYTKLIVVRHPYRRLANLWDDDFRVEGTATRWRLGPQLIEKYHGKGSYKHGDMLSYEDYVKYITSGESESYYGIRNFNACQPCLVGYDAIRRIETGPVDSMDILKQLEIFDNPIIQDAEKHHGMRALTTNIHPLKEVPADLKEKLYKMYRPDLDLFGYTQDGDRASCLIERENGGVCC